MTRGSLNRMFVVVTNVLCLFTFIIQPVHLSLIEPFRWIDKEAELIDLAQKYMSLDHGRLETLKDYQEGLEQHATLYKSEDDLAFNPLAIYKAIKHLTKDLEEVKIRMKKNSYDDTIPELFKKIGDTLPDENHVYKEIRHLIQTQLLHNITVIDMVEGRLGPNVTVQPALTPQDCFYIGKTCSEKHDHKWAIDWLHGCRHTFDEDMYHRRVSRIVLRSALFEEDYFLARDMIDFYLKKDHNERILDDLDVTLSPKIKRVSTKPPLCGMAYFHFTDSNVLPLNSLRYINTKAQSEAQTSEDYLLARAMISTYLTKDRNERILNDLNLTVSRRLGRWLSVHQYMLWESFNVCAGDYDNDWPYRPMKCRYNHHNSPFLTIAPLKEEIQMTTPLISVFREALYDSEIERLKAEVYPNMTPGSVLDNKGGSVVEPRYFPCHRYHLPKFNEKFQSLYRRLEDISALMHTEATTLQVIYYIPGGFIRVHSDFSKADDPAVVHGGHRIAQAVLYLSDVILGGETVFPRAKLKITPVKGSIAMWTNMRVDGAEEQFSYHTGCPVIVGEKIIATQWFRSKKQDRWLTKPEDKLTPEMIERENFDLDIKKS